MRILAMVGIVVASLAGIAAAQRNSTYIAGEELPPVIGNGQVMTQQRRVADFRRISLLGSGDVIVRVGPATSLSVTADSNILPFLETRVRGDELELKPTRSYHSRSKPRYVVTTPDIRSVQIAGSGDARVEGVANRQFAIAIHGSGKAVAHGRTGALNVAISGSGEIDARALQAGQAAVTIAGSGDARVMTNGTLSGTIAGSGNIRYLGRPSVISVSRAGSGSVAPLR